MGYSSSGFYEEIHKRLKKKTIVPSIDAHLHVVDFLQEGESADALFTEMEAGNIQKAVVFGMPVKKKWAYYRKDKPSYYLSDNAKCYYYAATDYVLANWYEKLSQTRQKRLAPLICGFNPTDVGAAQEVLDLLNRYDCWRGLGEILCRHDDLTNLTMGEVARPNHEAMFPIYELCAQKNLPILIHQNATSEWESEDIEAKHEYLEEFIEVLERFPETTFVWAHCGVSRRTHVNHYTSKLDQMLEKYPQLYMDISWVVFDDVICDGEEPKKRWLELFEKYPDRFMLGSDLLGHYDDLGRSMGRYNVLLKKLSKPTLKMLAYDNANKMWFGKRAGEVVDEDEKK